MSDTKSKFTAEQTALVNEFVARYNIEPDEIKFFTGDPEPFLNYDAACVVLDKLVPLTSIKPTVAESPLSDSICTQVELTFADGKKRYGLGVANVNERNEDNEPFTDQQLLNLSTSRGLRQAMRSAAINLVRLHRGDKVKEFTGSTNNREVLLRQVHALGEECGYIDKHGKALWQRYLNNRYGVPSSAQLTDFQLTDLASSLKAIVPVDQKLAA